MPGSRPRPERPDVRCVCEPARVPVHLCPQVGAWCAPCLHGAGAGVSAHPQGARHVGTHSSPAHFLGTWLEEAQVNTARGREQGAPLSRELIKGPWGKETWCLQEPRPRPAWGLSWSAARRNNGLRAQEPLRGTPGMGRGGPLCRADAKAWPSWQRPGSRTSSAAPGSVDLRQMVKDSDSLASSVKWAEPHLPPRAVTNSLEERPGCPTRCPQQSNTAATPHLCITGERSAGTSRPCSAVLGRSASPGGGARVSPPHR